MTNRVSSTCFNDTTLSQAWTCNVLIFTGMTMNIQRNERDRGGYTIDIDCNETLTLANNVYSYGEQPFVIPHPKPMELVNDTFQPARGAAWFTMMPFNKTVIVPENLLTANPASSNPPLAARNFNNAFGSGDFKRKGIAQVGDKPWVCTWPETFLEIFIYPNQNSSWNKVSPTGSSSSTTPTATVPPGSATSPNNNVPRNGAYASNGYPPSPSAHGDGSGGATPTGPESPVDTSSWPMPPPIYPKVMKIEERRIDRSPMPTCRQVEITGDPDRPARPVKDEDGNEVVIYIVENEPPPPGAQLHNKVIEYRQVSEMSDCGCMWFIT